MNVSHKFTGLVGTIGAIIGCVFGLFVPETAGMVAKVFLPIFSGVFVAVLYFLLWKFRFNK
jgi:hypothetical protein